jgi:hypothetical protein
LAAPAAFATGTACTAAAPPAALASSLLSRVRR